MLYKSCGKYPLFAGVHESVPNFGCCIPQIICLIAGPIIVVINHHPYHIYHCHHCPYQQQQYTTFETSRRGFELYYYWGVCRMFHLIISSSLVVHPRLHIRDLTSMETKQYSLIYSLIQLLVTVSLFAVPSSLKGLISSLSRKPGFRFLKEILLWQIPFRVILITMIFTGIISGDVTPINEKNYTKAYPC